MRAAPDGTKSTAAPSALPGTVTVRAPDRQYPPPTRPGTRATPASVAAKAVRGAVSTSRGAPCCAMAPASISVSLSARAVASTTACVTITVVVPVRHT